MTDEHVQGGPLDQGFRRSGQCWLVALAVFVALAGFYVGLVVYLDNTNFGTSNGLWKAPLVRNWETNTGRPIESGDPLYLPVYGLLSGAIPDRVVSYGVRGSFFTFRKMAILNALFGALASCAVFLLAVRFLRSKIAALTVCLGHALAAFILLNSLNSEDVMPAYAFFVIASALLFEYLATRKWFWLPASVMFFVLVMLFHWTLIVPSLAAAGTVLLALALIERRQRWPPAAFFALFFLAVLLASGVSELVLGTSIPVLELLYPGKARPSGYLGLSADKVVLAAHGSRQLLLRRAQSDELRRGFWESRGAAGNGRLVALSGGRHRGLCLVLV